MFQCCLLVLLTVPHAFAVPFSDLSCAQITSLINENQFNSFNDNGWLSYRVERDNGTILTTVVTSAGALEQLDASHRNVRLMRRRAQLALWRSHLTTLSDSRHVVSLLGSAMQCGAHSGIVLSHVNAPLTPPRTLCELLSLAVQLVELLRDLSLPGRTFVLCDWNLRQFGVDRSGRNVQLHDVAALFAVHADAPLGSDLVCSSANHSLVCGQSCVMSANDRDNVIDELSCRGAAHGGELGVCNGLDERLNVWSLGTMLNSLYSSIDVTNNELRDLLTRMRKSAVNARPSIAELQTLLARLSSECTFEAHDDNIASSKSIASNVVDVKLAFGSRNEATRAKGGALMRSAGAAGSTAHCFLHVQFPRLCAPYFLCIGAQKGGTQTFLDWIQEHPNVVMAEQELHFWDYGGIERSLADYYDDLPLVPPGKRRNGAQVVVGEKTPRYSVERIRWRFMRTFPKCAWCFWCVTRWRAPSRTFSTCVGAPTRHGAVDSFSLRRLATPFDTACSISMRCTRAAIRCCCRGRRCISACASTSER
jgi:hypothetical protein